MLNYEYDAEAEHRVLRQEAANEGIDLMAKLIRNGLSVDEAIIEAKRLVLENHSSVTKR